MSWRSSMAARSSPPAARPSSSASICRAPCWSSSAATSWPPTAALKHDPAIDAVALFGNTLHVTAGDEAAARAAIAASGITVQRLERIEPSLEDAFVAIIEQSASNDP